MAKVKHPQQPVYRDPHWVVRFKPNKIIQLLLDRSKFNLNDLAVMSFADEDRQQLAQLIGYSVDGFADLPYASKESIEQADAAMAALK